MAKDALFLLQSPLGKEQIDFRNTSRNSLREGKKFTVSFASLSTGRVESSLITRVVKCFFFCLNELVYSNFFT